MDHDRTGRPRVGTSGTTIAGHGHVKSVVLSGRGQAEAPRGGEARGFAAPRDASHRHGIGGRERVYPSPDPQHGASSDCCSDSRVRESTLSQPLSCRRAAHRRKDLLWTHAPKCGPGPPPPTAKFSTSGDNCALCIILELVPSDRARELTTSRTFAQGAMRERQPRCPSSSEFAMWRVGGGWVAGGWRCRCPSSSEFAMWRGWVAVRRSCAYPQPRAWSRSSSIPKWCAISCTTVTATSSRTSSASAQTRNVGLR